MKETHKTLRNSESGVEKMAVGQHLGGKGRVIERRRHNGNNIEEERQYIEMDEGYLFPDFFYLNLCFKIEK